MHTIISFLRGINVGGNKIIKMADLRDLYASLGFANTKTLLQSGNAVFHAETDDLAKIQKMIADGIQGKYGFDVDIMLRTPEQLEEAIANHPFTKEQLDDPKKISFVYLDGEPEDTTVEELRENNSGNEIIHVKGYTLYIYYTDGKGRSKLDNNRIQRTLKVKATDRNWNTTMKVHKLLEDFE